MGGVSVLGMKLRPVGVSGDVGVVRIRRPAPGIVSALLLCYGPWTWRSCASWLGPQGDLLLSPRCTWPWGTSKVKLYVDCPEGGWGPIGRSSSLPAVARHAGQVGQSPGPPEQLSLSEPNHLGLVGPSYPL